MDVVYASERVREQCESRPAAKKLFGGDEGLVRALFSRINALTQAINLKDIVVQKHYRFHKLLNKDGRNYEGLFAIDVKSKTSPWRILLRPLDENGVPFEPCNIDEIADVVEIVRIERVSKHYE